MSDDAVGWITRLDADERRLLGAFRSAARALRESGGELGREAQAEIAAALGTPRHEPVPPCFRDLMLTLGQHARRDLRVHVPACPCLGADEALFLWLYGHLAAGATDQAQARAHCLVEDDAVPTLLYHTAELAELRFADDLAPAATDDSPRTDDRLGPGRHLH